MNEADMQHSICLPPDEKLACLTQGMHEDLSTLLREYFSLFSNEASVGVVLAGLTDITGKTLHHVVGEASHELLKYLENIHTLRAIQPKELEAEQNKINKREYIFRGLEPFITAYCAFYPILSIPKELYDEHYERLPLKGKRKDSVPSFFESSVTVLSEMAAVLNCPKDELLYPKSVLFNMYYESAARKFLADVATMLSANSGGRFLYYHLNCLAAMKYERKTVNAVMFLTDPKSYGNGLEKVLTLDTPVALARHREVRKLLEMTDRPLHSTHSSHRTVGLLSDGCHVHGLSRIREEKEGFEEKYLQVDISYNSWQVNYESKLLMLYDNGRLSVYGDRFNAEELQKHINAFTQNSECRDKIKQAIRAASRAMHGTILVFSHFAAEEAGNDRLANDSFVPQPFAATPDKIALLTAIDGAVLLDADCQCQAFGVILDGSSKHIKSDMSRGARYNSAVRYQALHHAEYSQKDKKGTANKHEHALIVVISDDGMVNVFLDKQ